MTKIKYACNNFKHKKNRDKINYNQIINQQV